MAFLVRRVSGHSSDDRCIVLLEITIGLFILKKEPATFRRRMSSHFVEERKIERATAGRASEMDDDRKEPCLEL